MELSTSAMDYYNVTIGNAKLPGFCFGGHPFYCLLSGENSLKAKTGFRLFFKVYSNV